MRLPYLSLLPIMSTTASPTPNTSTSPVHWLLAGDSTTAPGGGWGDAFLSTTVAPGSSGANYGHSGATTASFRAGGDWDRVLSAIAANRDTKRVYVTIQVRARSSFFPLPSFIFPLPSFLFHLSHAMPC
jgi:hypothetical protein